MLVDAAQFGFGVDAGQVRVGVQHRQGDVLAHAQVGDDALALAIFGHHAQPRADRLERRARVDHLTLQPHLGAVAPGVGAEQRRHQLRAPGPHQAGDAKDFTAPEHEGDVVDALSLGVVDVVAGDVTRLENYLAHLMGLGGVEVAHFAADHLRDDPGDVHVGHGGGRDVLAVANYCNGVAHRRHFIELVRDIHTGHALGLEAPDSVQQHLDFATGQGRGGLVEDQQARLFIQRLGDLHQLLVAAAILRHRQRHIHVRHLEFTHQRLGAVQHRRVVHAPTGQGQFVAHENVLGHRQVGHQGQFLMNDDNPGGLGFADGLGLERLPIPEDFPLPGAVRVHRRQHLHQGGFTRTVFTAQAHTLPRFDLDVDAVKGVDTAKAFDDAVHL